MKRLKRINEYFGIYSRLWTIREKDFIDLVVDLKDVSSEFSIGYTYAKIGEKTTELFPKKWASPDDVDIVATSGKFEGFIPAIWIETSFDDPGDIERTIEYLNAFAEAKDRLKEKFSKKGRYYFIQASVKGKNGATKSCIGYNFLIMDE